jgi:hypothetical protein
VTDTLRTDLPQVGMPTPNLPVGGAHGAMNRSVSAGPLADLGIDASG